jgi:hypothetical protein
MTLADLEAKMTPAEMALWRWLAKKEAAEHDRG